MKLLLEKINRIRSAVFDKKNTDIHKQFRGSLSVIIGGILVSCIILFIFIWQDKRTKERIVERSLAYSADSSTELKRRIEGQFDNAELLIVNLSEEFSRILSADGDVLWDEALEVANQFTFFDSMAYVTPDGIYHSEDGDVDVKEREFYIKGFNGETGNEFLDVSKSNDEPTLCFYTPVFSTDNKIIGVLVGHYNQDKIDSMLSRSFFSVPLDVFLINVADGKVMGSSAVESGKANNPRTYLARETNISTLLASFNYAKSGMYDNIMLFLNNNVRDTMNFSYFDGDGKEGVCSIIKVEANRYVVVQIVPAVVVTNMVKTANVLSNFVITIVFIVFLIYVTWLIFISRKQRKLLVTMVDEATAEANAANEAKTKFLANMSHEIRTPLNAVIGMSEMLLRSDLNENDMAYANSIKTSGRNLLSIVNDILDFSKIESGKMEIVPVEYDISTLVHDVVSGNSIRAAKKNLNFDVNVSSEVPSKLSGDDVRIRQILNNLLSNAVKYTESGSVKLSVTCNAVKGNEKTVKIKFAVEDTGIGLDWQQQKKMFESFSRFDLEKNRNIEGTGLGLNITKSLIELMGGTLDCYSTKDVGTTFLVTITQEIVDFTPVGDYMARVREDMKRDRAYKSSVVMPNVKVLIVDDNQVNLDVAVNLLDEFEIKCETANSGFECIAKLKECNDYDLIFMDHMMPVMDGIECLKKIREMDGEYYKNVPIVALTANAVSGMKKLFEEEGFQGFVAKPIQMRILSETLLDIIPKNKQVAAEPKKKKPRSSYIEEEISGLSMNAALIEFGGKMDAYNDILMTYYTEGRKNVERLSEYISADNYKDYTILAHAIKSSSRMIGAYRLADIAALHEHIGKAGYNDYQKENVHKLISDYTDILDNIEVYLKDKDLYEQALKEANIM